jgi:NAD(P)H-hydrate epimerase
MRLVRAEEMQAIDRQAIKQIGIPGVVLMENAGRAATDVFCRELAELFPGPVLVLAGKGNNGGDGYVMARLLAERGWQVKTLVLGRNEDIIGDAEVMLEILLKLEQPVTFVGQARALRSGFRAVAPTIIVDALLGTGLKSRVRGLYAEAIEITNSSGVTVFSVDIPSGVDGSTGQLCGVAVQADLTVTFDHAKIGHGSNPGAACAGMLQVVDIGIPVTGRPDLESDVLLVDAEDAAGWLPDRSMEGHKGSFGHLLMLAGSTGKSGAAALAGNAVQLVIGLREQPFGVIHTLPVNFGTHTAAHVFLKGTIESAATGPAGPDHILHADCFQVVFANEM